jgi:pimeloyl-ACP methyl ester carboxylesterase
MAGYAQIGDVNTWYDERGDGEPVVVLHPGGADARAMDGNVEALAAHWRVLTPERRGHGRTPDVDGPISYELMARDTIAFIEQVIGEPVHLLGCSDGSTVGLLVEKPGLCNAMIAEFLAAAEHGAPSASARWAAVARGVTGRGQPPRDGPRRSGPAATTRLGADLAVSHALPSKRTSTRSAPRSSGLRRRNTTLLANVQSERTRTLRDESVATSRLNVTVTSPAQARAPCGRQPVAPAAPVAQRGGA